MGKPKRFWAVGAFVVRCWGSCGDAARLFFTPFARPDSANANLSVVSSLCDMVHIMGVWHKADTCTANAVHQNVREA